MVRGLGALGGFFAYFAFFAIGVAAMGRYVDLARAAAGGADVPPSVRDAHNTGREESEVSEERVSGADFDFGQNVTDTPPAMPAGTPADAVGPSDAGHPPASPGDSAPRELSFAERVATGCVNAGWSAAGWATRLDYLAGRCEADHPALAAQYRTWANNITAPLDR